MADTKKIFSIIINWCDGDSEQGTYGWTGRAVDQDEAENLARRDMWANNDEEDEYPEDDEPYGSVVECVEGASWRAKDMEQALRSIVSAMTPDETEAALQAGRKILAEIDAL